jgi:alpha-D-ribose 1-methylphosphonate 5-triphosphate synthase subunit PhnH
MSIDLPGFADPVAEAQACFRAVLDAMARPGHVHHVGEELRAPQPLMPTTAALLLTLVDMSTLLWLSPDCAPACDWIRFHCGAHITPDPAVANFAVTTSFPDLAALSAGTDEAPEESATVIVQVAAIGRGRTFRLQGPGLREAAALRVDGLPDDFATDWAANQALYPRGVDVLLVAGTALVALPRSVSVASWPT